MPSQRHTFVSEGRTRKLVISSGPFWKDLSVRLDGQIIGAISGGMKELEAGREFRLPDHSILRIQLNQGVMGLHEPNPRPMQGAMPVGLVVLRDGVPLQAYIADPAQGVKTAYQVLYLIGGLYLVLGSAALVLRLQALQALGFGSGSIVLGVVFLLLGVLTMRRSLIALKAAILLFALEGMLAVLLAMGRGLTLVAGELIIRLFLLVVLGYGVLAMKELFRAGP